MQFPVFIKRFVHIFVKLQNGSELDADIEVFTPVSVNARSVLHFRHFCTLLTSVCVARLCKRWMCLYFVCTIYVVLSYMLIVYILRCLIHLLRGKMCVVYAL